jgi:hypothetical protein
MSREGSSEPIAVALKVAQLFDALGVRYVVGGSLASSVHGEPRSTLDVDVVADLVSEHVAAFVTALGDGFYVDTDTVAQAVRDAASFNAIQIASSIKLDVFVAGRDVFEADRLASAVEVSVGPNPSDRLRIDSPAHLVLRKLEWYRRGGEVSDRQWRDVTAIVSVQGNRLDRSVLRRWAPVLGVSDLVERLDLGFAR